MAFQIRCERTTRRMRQVQELPVEQAPEEGQVKEWISFVERLHFVEYGGKLYAIMAYSRRDAWSQVHWAKFWEGWRLRD